MKKRFLGLLLAAAWILSACGSGAGSDATAPEPQLLTVFAAASLTDAFRELGTNFSDANPGVTIRFGFGSSRALRTQIEQGAQVDVFASAHAAEMDALVSGGLVAAGASQVFLTNQLVVILPASNPAGLTRLADLTRHGLKLVMAAKEVPVGGYSLAVLELLEPSLGAGFKAQVLANVVSYENDVKQVVAKVQLGEADAGIVYRSDTVAAPDVQKIEIPAENNIVASYPLAALTAAGDPVLAGDFIAYVLSPDGQSILKKWGFLPVQ